MKPSVDWVDRGVYVSVGKEGWVGRTETLESPDKRYSVIVEYAADDYRVMGVYFHGVDWFGEEDDSDDGWDGSTSEGQWL